MRKYFLAALCTALCMSVSVPAFAADETAEYKNMSELYNSWFRNEDYKYNYPDYVCGVWTETGDMSELVIAVTEDEKGEAGKEEILSLIEDDSSVKFVYQKYSYNELRDLQEEIGDYAFDLKIGVWGICVSEMENCLKLDIENPESPEMQEFIEECKEKYGDKIAFEVGGAPTAEADEVVLDTEEVIITEVEETAVPATEISEADDFSDAEEGGLVPTVIDDTIEPEIILPEEEWNTVYPSTALGANEIVPTTREDGTPIAKYMTMGDLYQAWYANREYEYYYPDYVCGVWTETGDMSELVVAVTKDEAGEAGKEEILSLIENDDSVKFTYQSYSYKELRQAQDEISSFMGDESGIYGLGVHEMENKVHANIDMSNPNAEDYIKKLLAAYGDMIVFEAGNGIILDAATEGFIDSAGWYGVDGGSVLTEEAGGLEIPQDIPGIGDYDAGGGLFATGINADDGASDTPAVTMEELAVTTEISIAGAEQDNKVWIFAVCAAAVVVLGAVAAFAVSRVRAKQTSAGIMAEGVKLTAGDTETIVARTTEEPSGDILGAVMSEIEK